MKGNRFSSRLSRLVLVYFLLCMIIGSLSGYSRQVKEESLAVIERDALQTRNFSPVINHHAMIVNLTDGTLTVDIHSPIPPGKYIKGSSLTAFGNDSLLGAPMFAPFVVPVKDHITLGKPGIKKDDSQVIYCWNNIEIPPENAAIAQYDNYYAPVESFYQAGGMEIAGLHLIGDYSVNKEGKLYRFKLNFQLKNAGEYDIDEMFFRFFLPNALALDDRGELHILVEPVEIWASENLDTTISTITDGYGNAARGIDSTIQIGTLKAGAEIQCVLQVDCKKNAEKGEIFPLFYILGRRKLTRLWPATIINGEAIKGVKKFHYLFYNLVIPDSRIFKLQKDGIVTVPAAGLRNRGTGRMQKGSPNLTISHLRCRQTRFPGNNHPLLW